MDEKSKRQFDAELRAKFELMFPRYSWEKTDFSIEYSSEVIWFNITSSADKLIFDYDEDIQKALSAARRVARKASEEPESIRRRRSPVREIREAVLGHLNNGYSEPRLESVVYIPAGRSFFANLHKNVFSFLSSNIPIDYFLKDFGAIYERTRDIVMNGHFRIDLPKGVTKLVDELVCGKYIAEKGQDWIISERGRISVSNSSSGQQEVLPMALMLSTWPYSGLGQIYRSFVIEEPEAHLFPVAQG
ncbi:hypothetical protein I5L51_08065 [Pseudomonas mendocina]|nr:hypothetical protein [Pseudomonas mendocina]MBH3339062.1 hypothetical protein [Pseudomonas mendocina]